MADAARGCRLRANPQPVNRVMPPLCAGFGFATGVLVGLIIWASTSPKAMSGAWHRTWPWG
jgi:hypothetical protein